jgi:hypothetical protein
MAIDTAGKVRVATAPAAPGSDVPLSVNEMRLGPRHWLAAVAILLGCAWGIPRLWKHVERFETGPDYRIPYQLSKDYWLYQWRLERIAAAAAAPAPVPVLGDSVIWGEYVRPDGTLPHFLGQETGQPGRFVNCGVNGLFPLAMEGLLRDYGGSLRRCKVIVHCNVLWMSSPRADLSSKKEQEFNHSRLVPQFSPRIPCYRADASERLSAVIERHVGFFGWVSHLDNVSFDQRSIPAWTLQADDSQPPRYPNAWRDPLKQITLAVPTEADDDPDRGPASPRHKPWTAGEAAAPARFEWVDLDASLQWPAFQRLVGLLQGRGCDVLVVLGPFNEHMVAQKQRPAFHKLREGIATWLAAWHIPHVLPETLPSELYADASHPLTEGYHELARGICRAPAFREWLER